MITGSVAAAYHGAPRATADIDFVIAPTLPQVSTIVAAFLDAGLYASESAALEAHRLSSMFNVVDANSGWKVDLILRKDRPFSREEFSRRIMTEWDGVSVGVATLEDVILSKLEWAHLGESRRQLEDAKTLLRVRQRDADAAYLAHWVEALGLGAEWKIVTRELTSYSVG
ncbi:MAG: hypothetical protein K2X99_00675 [Gemmatimonadaceae bacterium]|nr:hypothetical protein [Gemmatimonadaceae bacterium]